MHQTLQHKLKGQLPAAAHTLRIDGTESSTTAYLIAHLFELIGNNQHFVVVAEDDKRALELSQDISCFVDPKQVKLFPSRRLHLDEAVLLSEHFSAERAALLCTLGYEKKLLIVCSMQALRQTTIPPELLIRYSKSLQVGVEVDLDEMVSTLVHSGYSRESMVSEPGHFALRGGIVDIFSPTQAQPMRIELFDTTIESIRAFNVKTQRSTKALETAWITPASEVILDAATSNQGQTNLKKFCDQRGYTKKQRAHLDDLLREKIHAHALEDILPLLYEQNTTLTDHLKQSDDDWQVAFVNRFAMHASQETLNERILYLKEQMEEKQQGIFDDSGIVAAEVIEKNLRDKPTYLFEDLENVEGEENIDNIKPDVEKLITLKAQEHSLVAEIRDNVDKGFHVHIVCYNESQKERLARIFATELQDESKKLSLLLGSLQEGFVSQSERCLFIPDRQIFGLTQRRQKLTATDEGEDVENLDLFKENSLVVHIDHGIGIYRGLKHLKIESQEADFILVEYQGGDKLYLPTFRFNLVQPYSMTSDDDAKNVVLDKLGSNAWSAKKAKAKRAIEAMAQELIKLYATRKLVKGFAFSSRDAAFSEFEASFPYTETRDQQKAIDEVLNDMETPRPMDRLICGDVGFGKTEVALRATFRAVLDGKQVAVLVPTTLLAHQHMHTFKERFKQFAVSVDVLSRARKAKEQKETLSKVADGKIDVLVGTHRMLSKDVQFKSLGLLIIDEEHRFGVSQKEKIKQFRTKVDVISMTATPIPRTLQMSLYGFRDLCIIETPPAERLPINTYVARFDDHQIRTAVLKEIKRGGQVFFVHNRIHTIDAMAKYLKRIVPEVSVSIVHGEKEEAVTEKVMLQFMNRQVDLLLATTIIESGLDFPNANTIVINRADRFGLAQLYQLRGRVGRSNKEAYAYLLIPGDDLISDKAQKRLRAIKSFTNLGSGYRIALRDLEVRGAGNLLGTKQSGQIRQVGIDLYTQLLEKAVKELSGEQLDDEVEPELKLSGSAYIPATYVDDESLRLALYRKTSSLNSDEELDDFRRELEDRFGKLPEVGENLLHAVAIRNLARRLRLDKIHLGESGLHVGFDERTRVAPEKLVAMLHEPALAAKMLDSNTLFLPSHRNKKAFSLEEVRKLLHKLG